MTEEWLLNFQARFIFGTKAGLKIQTEIDRGRGHRHRCEQTADSLIRRTLEYVRWLSFVRFLLTNESGLSDSTDSVWFCPDFRKKDCPLSVCPVGQGRVVRNNLIFTGHYDFILKIIYFTIFGFSLFSLIQNMLNIAYASKLCVKWSWLWPSKWPIWPFYLGVYFNYPFDYQFISKWFLLR